jgi:hypothetical protein
MKNCIVVGKSVQCIGMTMPRTPSMMASVEARLIEDEVMEIRLSDERAGG